MDIFKDHASTSTEEVPEVPIEHLDYGFVEKCTSSKELAAILRVLEVVSLRRFFVLFHDMHELSCRGKEGKYEHLEKTVEAKLLGECCPVDHSTSVCYADLGPAQRCCPLPREQSTSQ